MLESCTRNVGDVTERGPPKACHDRTSGAACALRLCLKVVEFLSGDGDELFQIIPRVESLLVDRYLSDDRVEEMTSFGHPGARPRGEITLRVEKRIAVLVHR